MLQPRRSSILGSEIITMAARLSYQEGLDLFKNAPLDQLQAAATKVRHEKNPGNRVTFVLDSNPNYTNVCDADCSFCAFYRHDGAKDAYTKSVAETLKHLEFARQAGLSTVMLQGGLHPKLTLEFYVDLVTQSKQQYPEIFRHYFTAPEIWNCAKVSQTTVRHVLQALWDAGQRTLPGGGAEIVSERVRLAISPKKMEPGAWIDVHKTAHQIGYRTTATMMYGHIEEPEDILTHLETIRAAQDEIPGFTAFIPWSYKRDRTSLRRSVKNWAGAEAYYRILAFSRIYLDNFDHIQASWFSEGKDNGVRSLHYGADDFGGIIMEENVHRATNFVNRTDHNGIVQMIRQAGFEPVQRNPLYQVLRTYEDQADVEVPVAQQVREADRLSVLQQVR
jgi:cyclic dehypoxanthinyl futalosine synthase